MRLYGFFTQNTMKTLYVLEEVGTQYEFQFVDLSKGEQKHEDFAGKTPVGKVPLLEHDGEYLFESATICRYVANEAASPLYPQEKMPRARVDQWIDFFNCHLGRWLTTLYFETVIKPKFGLGEPDQGAVDEAHKFIASQFEIVDAHLSKTGWFANDAISIADLYAFALVEQVRHIDVSLDEHANLKDWFDRVESRSSIASARARIEQ